MHSLMGILISSFLLTVFSFATIVLVGSSLWIIPIIFSGLLFGQFMHLLEDSCAVSGINWMFPFGTKEINGNMNTFQKEEIRDIRPAIFQYSLCSISLAIFLMHSFNISLDLWIFYPIIAVVVISIWIIIMSLSKTEYGFWCQDIKTIRNVKKI